MQSCRIPTISRDDLQLMWQSQIRNRSKRSVQAAAAAVKRAAAAALTATAAAAAPHQLASQMDSVQVDKLQSESNFHVHFGRVLINA